MKRLLHVVVSRMVMLATLVVLVGCSPFAPADAPTPLPITPVFFATDTPTPVPDPIYLNLIWTFHQPLYPVDAQTNLVTNPGVRIASTQSYHPIATALQKHPRVHATFSFSPVLLRQMDDILAGARDRDWELATRPAAGLSDDDKRYILSHFFALSAPEVISRFPRYKELHELYGSGEQMATAVQSLNEQDWRDLQVWANLVTFDADQLAEPPLRDLVDKGRDFSEGDKRVLFDTLLATLRAIAPLYTQLQDSGQAEVATAPYAQPVLPLLADTNVAAAASPAISKDQLPTPPFRSSQDVGEHLKRAVSLVQREFGRAPRGLTPVAGAVAPNILAPVAGTGFQWLLSGEEVLAKSLHQSPFKRGTEGVAEQADALYRPYRLQTPDGAPITLFFRDAALSTQFTLAMGDMSANPDDAARDLIQHIMAIKAHLPGLGQEKGNTGAPHLVTVVIDGDALAPNYPDRARALLLVSALFQQLSAAAERFDIQTVTPSEYLEKAADVRPLAELAPGTWVGGEYGDFGAWIGTPAANAAWESLSRARTFIDAYLSGAKTTDPAALARAYDAMLLAEGSDWLQTYSASSASPSAPLTNTSLTPASAETIHSLNRAATDRAFRGLLAQVYASVGVPTPDYVQIPILPTAVLTAESSASAVITPTIDGVANEGEWSAASVIRNVANDPSSDGDGVDALYYGANAQNIYFRVDAREEWGALATSIDSPLPLRVSVYFAKPDVSAASAFTRVGGDGEVRTALGMSATHVLEWSLDPDGTSSTALYAANDSGGWTGAALVSTPGAAVGKVLEMAAPLQALGGLDSNSVLNLIVVVSREGQTVAVFPHNGVAQVSVPNLGGSASTVAENVLGVVNDPAGDDHGPGSYTYPTDPVFEKGAYDLKRITLATHNQNLVFRIELNGPINNAWNSPIGLSIQTFDIYIDKDPGKGSGERKLLEGRNAALPRKDGWDIALWVEGWYQQLIVPGPKGALNTKPDVPILVAIDPKGTATIEVPLAALGEGDPRTWAYAVVVLSQEAFPSEGVRRVRDVAASASQWQSGGAPNATNHSRILDVLVPAGAALSQEQAQSRYPASQQTDLSKLSADDFGIVPLITFGK
jgi:alpha-amylase/alpha-mannosidase (GH57 family)